MQNIFKRLFSCTSVQKEDGELPSSSLSRSSRSRSIQETSNADLNTICIIDYSETQVFAPPITEGQVIKVYDGDTITIATRLPYPGSPLYRFPVRLNGIDCPEIKSHSEDEKSIAQLAKKELEELIMHKTVTLKNIQNEKYGRVLADVYLNDLHLNQYMIMKKFAVAYDGGTKKPPQNWVKFHFTGQSD